MRLSIKVFRGGFTNIKVPSSIKHIAKYPGRSATASLWEQCAACRPDALYQALRTRNGITLTSRAAPAATYPYQPTPVPSPAPAAAPMSTAAASGAAEQLDTQNPMQEKQQQQQDCSQQQGKQQQQPQVQPAGQHGGAQQHCRTGQAQQQQEQQLTQQSRNQLQQHHQQANVTRRVAVLECEDAEKWKCYTESLWKAALWEEGDEWTIYQVCKGHMPTPAEAAGFDWILVSGSHYSVYEQHEWLQQLLELLPQYAATGVNIYGCCFGCQALAQALGGSVGPNPSGDFVLTTEHVQPTQELQQFKQLAAVVQAALTSTQEAASLPAAAPATARAAAAATAAAATGRHLDGSTASSSAGTDGSTGSSSGSCSERLTEQLTDLGLGEGASSSSSSRSDNGSNGCGAGGCFRLLESHGDQVLTLPPGAVVLASSPTAPYELWSWGTNVLASQFHIEFDESLVLDKIWTSLTNVGRLNAQQSADSRRVLEAGGQHSVQMLQVVKHFLKNGVQ